jgi:hypothetical protein
MIKKPLLFRVISIFLDLQVSMRLDARTKFLNPECNEGMMASGYDL